MLKQKQICENAYEDSDLLERTSLRVHIMQQAHFHKYISARSQRPAICIPADPILMERGKQARSRLPAIRWIPCAA